MNFKLQTKSLFKIFFFEHVNVTSVYFETERSKL